MVPYVIGSIVFYILSEFYHPLFGLVVPIGMICTGIMLRLHFVRMYNIRAGGPCVECMTGCCCMCCSLAQSKRIATHRIALHLIDSSPCIYRSLLSSVSIVLNGCGPADLLQYCRWSQQCTQISTLIIYSFLPFLSSTSVSPYCWIQKGF
jgi:Cys-rich protein (TIGR01571 family)